VSAERRAGARIAITGAGSASPAARSLLRAELDDVRQLASDDTFADADMLVFVADAGESADARTAQLAHAARERGLLVAAIVVTRDRTLGRSALLAALRDAADMVMIVRDPSDVHAVIAALR